MISKTIIFISVIKAMTISNPNILKYVILTFTWEPSPTTHTHQITVQSVLLCENIKSIFNWFHGVIYVKLCTHFYETLTNYLVSNRLDYWNSLLYGIIITVYKLQRLHRISVLSLFHIVLLLVKGGVHCPITSWLLMILITGFTNLKSISILSFLLLVPSCRIHYPWVIGQLTL